MLIIRETGCGVYGNSLYYPLNFSINLKLLKIKCIFKKFQQVDAEECMQCNTIYIKFKTYKTIIAEEYREEFHPLLSLKVSVFLFHRNIYLVFEPSFVFVCIFVYMNMYVCCRYIHTYIAMYIVCMYAYIYIYIFWEQRRCIYARRDQAILTRCPLDFLKMFMLKAIILVWIFPTWWETCKIFHIPLPFYGYLI